MLDLSDEGVFRKYGKSDIGPEYPYQRSLFLTWFGKVLLRNNPILASDIPDDNLVSVNLLNATGITAALFGTSFGMNSFINLVNGKPMTMRTLGPVAHYCLINSALIGCVGSFCLWGLSRFGCSPRILLLQEEHVTQKLKEKSDAIPDIRTAFGENEFAKFRNGPSLDKCLVSGSVCGLATGLLMSLLPSKHKTLKDRLLHGLRYSIVGTGFGTICGSWLHQGLTGGPAARDRLRKHRVQNLPSEKEYLEQRRVVEKTRAERLAEFRQMSWTERMQLNRKYSQYVYVPILFYPSISSKNFGLVL